MMIHWASSTPHLPSSYQEEVADFLFDHGADLVLGGHPHVMQPMELQNPSGRPDGLSGLFAGQFYLRPV